MKLNEITKDEFVRKLTDPAEQEILDLIKLFDDMDGISCKLEEYRPGIVEFHCKIDGPTKTDQRPVVKMIAIAIEESTHWKWDTCQTPKNPDTAWVCFVVGKDQQ